MRNRVPRNIVAVALAVLATECAAAPRRAIESPITNLPQQFDVAAVEVRLSHGVPAFSPPPIAGAGQEAGAGALAPINAAAATVPPIPVIDVLWLAAGIALAPIGAIAGAFAAHPRGEVPRADADITAVLMNPNLAAAGEREAVLIGWCRTELSFDVEPAHDYRTDRRRSVNDCYIMSIIDGTTERVVASGECR